MKNKTIQRILSFTLALILCFSIVVKPVEAKALAVESWLIYAIITYMAAVGFTFTAAGGANALMSAVEDRWGEFQEHKKGEGIIIDIAPYIQYKPPTPSPGGNGFDIGPKFWYGVAAAAAIKDFIEWLKSDQLWEPGEEIKSSYFYGTFPAVLNGEDIIVSTSVISESTKETAGSYERYKITDFGVFLPYSFSDSVNVLPETFYYYSENDGKNWFSTANNYSRLYHFYSDSSGNTSSGYARMSNILSDFGVSHYSDLVGITLVDLKSYYSLGLTAGLIDANGYFYPARGVPFPTSYIKYDNGYTITIPETNTAFEVDENQLVEISFDAFSDDVIYETPEEFAEAIEQTIADTGTIPSIKSEVILDPDSVPDIEPSAPPSGEITPNPDTPENPDLSDYPNIEELGLPALGDALFKKFPFCIPNDLKTFFGVLTAEPETPYWEVDLTGDALGIESKFVIDLTEYEVVGRMSRWGSVITFCLFLIMNTKRFIGW